MQFGNMSPFQCGRIDYYINKQVMNTEFLKSEIIRLKKEKNAVILGHYYQREEIQDLSDYIGDSLALAQMAQKCDNDIIVFCG